MIKKEWAIACGPAVANLLAQQVNKRGDMPDAAALFSVLQYIGPDCNYAIPAIFSLALRQKDSELGQKAHGFLLAFDGDALRPYRYHLQWLPEL